MSQIACKLSPEPKARVTNMRSEASLFAPMVSIRFFYLVRPKIQDSRSGAGSESGTFAPLGKKHYLKNKNSKCAVSTE